jgi:hypothetical protein
MALPYDVSVVHTSEPCLELHIGFVRDFRDKQSNCQAQDSQPCTGQNARVEMDVDGVQNIRFSGSSRGRSIHYILHVDKNTKTCITSEYPRNVSKKIPKYDIALYKV